MARRDSGKKAAKGGKTLRAAGKLAAAGARTTKKSARSSDAAPSDDPKWPNRRDILYKPERLKYVRKQIKFEGCVFCDAAKRADAAGTDSPERKNSNAEPRYSQARRDSLVLYVDDRVMVVMNKYPYNTGHLLVLPRRHEGVLQDLTTEENQVVFLMVQHCVEILQEVYEPAGFNVGLNLGASAGAGIPEHLHVHIIPRWNGDTNFFPLIAQTKVVVETLEQTFDRLIGHFERGT